MLALGVVAKEMLDSCKGALVRFINFALMPINELVTVIITIPYTYTWLRP